MLDEARLSEQRGHPRALVGRPVQFRHRGLTLSGLLWEISEGGARLQSGVPLPCGEPVQLRLPFDQWCSSAGSFELEGKVVRSRGGQAALAFGRRLLPRHMLMLRDFVWRARRGC